MQVTFFQRKPHQFHFSIEAIFEGVRKHLPSDISQSIAVCKYESIGFIKRIKNIVDATKHQGDINHITGDVHYLALSLKKHKTILTIHDCGFMNTSSPIARGILWLFWLKLPVISTSMITTISESTKSDIIRYTGCKPEKIQIIPDFIDNIFKPSPKRLANVPTFLIIGTKPNKNIPRILEALEGIPCKMNVVGEPKTDLKDQLRKQNIEFNWFTHISNKELYQVYIDSDILLFPSTLEGFGMPIIEAQTVERPVITSNISSMPEVAGEGACLVDPFDVQSIRDGILKVIDDKEYRDSLIEKGRYNVKRFHPETISKMYYELYKEIYFKHKKKRVSL